MLNLFKRHSEVLIYQTGVKRGMIYVRKDFGNNPDRTVMSLFYVGSIVYIHDDIILKKKKKKRQNCRQPS